MDEPSTLTWSTIAFWILAGLGSLWVVYHVGKSVIETVIDFFDFVSENGILETPKIGGIMLGCFAAFLGVMALFSLVLPPDKSSNEFHSHVHYHHETEWEYIYERNIYERDHPQRQEELRLEPRLLTRTSNPLRSASGLHTANGRIFTNSLGFAQRAAVLGASYLLGGCRRWP